MLRTFLVWLGIIDPLPQRIMGPPPVQGGVLSKNKLGNSILSITFVETAYDDGPRDLRFG